MEKLVRKLRRDFPAFSFAAGKTHCWSPGQQKILYACGDEQTSTAGVLHELGHALLGHRNFDSDIELLQKEVDAWQEALRLAERYQINIGDEYVQDCLDSYRDWLFRRSRCPRCQSTGAQTNRLYQCVNCGNTWAVGSSCLSRPYRRQMV